MCWPLFLELVMISMGGFFGPGFYRTFVAKGDYHLEIHHWSSVELSEFDFFIQGISRWWQLKYFFIFTPKIGGRWTQFDEYFSKGLVQPPTRYSCSYRIFEMKLWQDLISVTTTALVSIATFSYTNERLFVFFFAGRTTSEIFLCRR